MANDQNGNVVELVDGIICYKQVGDQTRQVSIRTVQALLLLTKGMDKIRLFVDYSESGDIDEETIPSGLYAMKSMNLDKVAIFGASEYLVNLINTLAIESGNTDVIHFVKSRDEAFKWLKQSDSSKSDVVRQPV